MASEQILNRAKSCKLRKNEEHSLQRTASGNARMYASPFSILRDKLSTVSSSIVASVSPTSPIPAPSCSSETTAATGLSPKSFISQLFQTGPKSPGSRSNDTDVFTDYETTPPPTDSSFSSLADKFGISPRKLYPKNGFSPFPNCLRVPNRSSGSSSGGHTTTTPSGAKSVWDYFPDSATFNYDDEAFEESNHVEEENDPCARQYIKVPVKLVAHTKELIKGMMIVTPKNFTFLSESCSENAGEHTVQCNLEHVKAMALFLNVPFLDVSLPDEISQSEHHDPPIVQDIALPQPLVTTKEEAPLPAPAPTPLVSALASSPSEGEDGATQSAASHELHPLGSDEKTRSTDNRAEHKDPTNETNADDASVKECYVRVLIYSPITNCRSIHWFLIPEKEGHSLRDFLVNRELLNYGGVPVGSGGGGCGLVKAEKSPEFVEAPHSPSVMVVDHLDGCNHSKWAILTDSWEELNISPEWEIVNQRGKPSQINVEDADVENLPLPHLSHSSCILNEERIRNLMLHLPPEAEGQNWHLVFSTNRDGCSLKTLYRQCLNMDGPCFLIVEDEIQCVFGALLSESPKVTQSFFGRGDTFVFRWAPQFEKFQWSGENRFFIKGSSKALFIGCSDGKAALWLDDRLFHGRSQACETFNNPPLPSSDREDFFVNNVEVWAFV